MLLKRLKKARGFVLGHMSNHRHYALSPLIADTLAPTPMRQIFIWLICICLKDVEVCSKYRKLSIVLPLLAQTMYYKKKIVSSVLMST